MGNYYHQTRMKRKRCASVMLTVGVRAVYRSRGGLLEWRNTPMTSSPDPAGSLVPMRRARDDAGYSLEQLAARTGVNKATLFRIEHGLQRPRPDTRKRIADALGLHPQRIRELHRNGDDDRDDSDPPVPQRRPRRRR